MFQGEGFISFFLCITIQVPLDLQKAYKRRGSKKRCLIGRKQFGHKMSISITVERDYKAGTVLEKVVEGFQRLGCTLDCIRKFHLLFQTLKNKSSFCLDPRNYLQRSYSSQYKRDRPRAFITILKEVSTTKPSPKDFRYLVLHRPTWSRTF